MEGFRQVFSDWELRIYITLSLVLQILPILWTYYRRRISSHPVQRVLWLTTFLAADFIATLSLGAIFHLNINPKSTPDSPQNKYLLALWAPFILLHLGKHSRITTFTLADNEFWLGHFIRFIYHELVALYICFLASTESRVKFISIILFLTGTIKFGERIIAMKRGSMNELRISTFKKADPGFTKHDVLAYLDGNNGAHIQGHLGVDDMPGDISEKRQRVETHNNDVKFLCAAYQSFNKYRGLYIDPRIEYGEQEDEGKSFRGMETENALKLIEMELGFAYDLFYTKVACFHPIWGWIVRFTSLASLLSAMISFSHIEKKGFLRSDIHITYMLLVAALILETESFLESMITDRVKVQIGLWEGRNWRRIENFIQRICIRMKNVRGIFLQRPSALMGQFNLLSFCFARYNSWSFVRRVLNIFELQDLWNNYSYSNYVELNNPEFKNRIFQGVQRRLTEEENVLNYTPMITKNLLNRQPGPRHKILPVNISSYEFEQCLLLLHVATDLCYRMAGEEPSNRLLEAKCLSEYMMYLLAIRPSALSTVTTAELKNYRDACATCERFYKDFEILQDGVEVYQRLQDSFGLFHDVLLEHRTHHNTLLWDAFEIANKLRNLGEENDQVWDFLFDVWVDMVSYVAINTHGKVNAELLGYGGEFITYIWLYMLHWRINCRYQL